MRGEHGVCQVVLHLDFGIIPACAGSTAEQSVSPPLYTGSSPHARGARLERKLQHTLGGIIPACAGSTAQRQAGKAGRTGSSPHARGAQIDRHLSSLLFGIIPACAGSTYPMRRGRLQPEDHPRMRGEHLPYATRPTTARGSSPHARGAPTCLYGRVKQPGIIPACAGSTFRAFRPSCQPRDHPRMRGEHIRGLWIAELAEGSSPHARGALSIRFTSARLLGIIPACAGSTPCMTWWLPLAWDHPRMRGEHHDAVRRDSESAGSSPHARGAPMQLEHL